MKVMRQVMLLVMFGVAACGSAVVDEEETAGPPPVPTVELDVSDIEERADRAPSWRSKVDGFTMRVESTLTPRRQRGETSWVMRGTTSKTMYAVRAYDATGHPFAVERVAPRTFEVALGATDVAGVLAGDRVYLDFFVEGKEPLYHGYARFGARFGNWSGASEVYVHRAVNPIVVGGEVWFRGRASVQAGYQLEMIYTDDDLDPLVMSEAKPRRYRFDWTPGELLLLADPSDEPVHFRIWDGAERWLEKRASVEFRLVQMGVTVESPLRQWPPQRCTDEVRECLAALEHSDTESCGWANEVIPCLGEVEVAPREATPERFIEDLTEEIERWYEEHARDAKEFGAPPVEEVIEGLDLDDVRRLDDEEAAEMFDDPEAFDVFWMPDPIFVGSDRVWYGVYERSGRLASIYVVN